jgi:hypothetical protein
MLKKTLIITVLVIAIVAVAGVATYIVQQRQDKGAEKLVDEFYETLKPYIRDPSIRTPVRIDHSLSSADFVIDVKKLTPEIIELAKSNFLAYKKCPSRIHFTRIWFLPLNFEGYDLKTGEWVKNPSYIFLPPDQEILFLELVGRTELGRTAPGYVFVFDDLKFAPDESDNALKSYHSIFKYYHKDGKEELTPGVIELELEVSQGGPCE